MLRKHPLLPEAYADSSMQASLLRALKPYVLTEHENINNPRVKWDLPKAWQDAQPYLKKAVWHYRGDPEEDTDAGWELAADTPDEAEILDIIVAGLIAHQMLEPDSGFSLMRIDYRKGGEMALIISGAVQQLLAKACPHAKYHKGEES